MGDKHERTEREASQRERMIIDEIKSITIPILKHYEVEKAAIFGSVVGGEKERILSEQVSILLK